MKKIIVGISIMTFLFSLFYLMGAFVETSFNIAEWDRATRGVVGVFGGMVSIVVACGFVDVNKDKF